MMKLKRKAFGMVELLVLSIVVTSFVVMAVRFAGSISDKTKEISKEQFMVSQIESNELTLDVLNDTLSSNNYNTLSGASLDSTLVNVGERVITCYDGDDNQIDCYSDTSQTTNSPRYFFEILWYKTEYQQKDGFNSIILKARDLENITPIESMLSDDDPISCTGYDVKQDFLDYNFYYYFDQTECGSILQDLWHDDSVYLEYFHDWVVNAQFDAWMVVEDYSDLESFYNETESQYELPGNKVYFFKDNPFEDKTTKQDIVFLDGSIGLIWWATLSNIRIQTSVNNIIIDGLRFYNVDIEFANNKNISMNNIRLLEKTDRILFNNSKQILLRQVSNDNKWIIDIPDSQDVIYK